MPKCLSHDGWKCTLQQDRIDVLRSGAYQGLYPLLKPPYCERCSSQGKSTTDCTWHARFHSSLIRVYAVGPYFEHGKSPINNDILSTHIWSLKFTSSEYAKPLGTALAMTAKSLYSNLMRCDLVVPVPPFAQTGKSYDHTDELAKVVSKLLGLPLNRLLSKTRGDRMTDKATVEDRWKSVEDLYVMVDGESELNKKTILLVDDICTSGATLSRCSHALTSQGKARGVYALVAGRRFDERCPI